ncbi:MAG: beta-lactamase family protein [Clostridia bacterium]|nr:beta-lactamase family protein [Clostridia bacterium]
MDFSKLTKYLDDLEKNYGVPGYDLIVRKDHETVYRRMGGYSDYAKTRPVADSDLYFMYSATKVITMAAVMQLVERGLIGLEDPVAKYLPEFAEMEVADHFVLNQWPAQIPTLNDPHHPAKTPITLRMLMTMTAGLNYDIGNAGIVKLREETGGKATTRQMMTAIAKMPLLFEPGTHYSYSLGHDVMAAVIEVVTGQTFGEYLKEHIFDPLGVTDAYFHLDDTLRSRLTAQYLVDMESGEMKPTEQSCAYCLSDCYDSGGAGLICTADAYETVMDALACGGVGKTGAQILTPASLAKLAENQLTPEMLPDYQMPWRMEYGYGLGVRTLIHPENSPTPQGEFGWDSAGGAYSLVDPVNHISVFYVQEILAMIRSYSEIHPALRNLIYESLN